MKNIENRDPNPSGVVFLQRISDDKIQQARNLRKTMTLEERLFWERVRHLSATSVYHDDPSGAG
jgi:very-short-patch-repair endonuclease